MSDAPTTQEATDGAATLTPGAKLAQKWIGRIETAERDMGDYERRCKLIREHYTEERRRVGEQPTARRFAMLWSNEQTYLPALYARTPEPVVERRFKDEDQTALQVSECLQRALSWTLDECDFDHTMRQCVFDYTTYARGQAWVRYEPELIQVKPRVPVVVGPDGLPTRGDNGEPLEGEPQTDEMGQPFVEGEPTEQLAFERVPIDYVHRGDFIHPMARSWDEVSWVARRVYMGRQDLVTRFGKKGEAIPLTQQEMADDGKKSPDKKAAVYEIWDKRSRKVIFVCKNYTADVLAADEPYYRLDGFFPCPRPAYGTISTDSLVPVPDYVYYQDQAEEINELTAKIGILIRSLRLAGFYRGEDATALNQAFNPGNTDVLIPIAGWEEFKEGGGAAGAIEWVPIQHVVAALKSCFETRQMLIQDVYQITGISDIVRGASDPGETATAQQIKAQFGSIRIRDRQQEIQRFARDLMRLAGEIIAERFQPQTLQAMTGMQVTEEMLALMRGDLIRTFRIDIETDSTIALDEQTEKETRNEFLRAVGGFLQQALPVAQTIPSLVPMLGQMLLFAVRGYRAGRELEGVITKTVEQMTQQAEQAANQPPPPDPAVELENKKLELEAQGLQQEGQIKQAEMQQDGQRIQIEGMQAQTDRIKAVGDLQNKRAQLAQPKPAPRAA
jgi:hypothetical protein